MAAESGMKDSTINSMFGAFNNISENLRAIKEKQGMLGKNEQGGVETGPDMEKRIAADLYMIDSLLSENKKLIERMRKNAKGNKNKISELEKTIALMEQTIAEKDTEIASLKEQLTSTNASLGEHDPDVPGQGPTGHHAARRTQQGLLLRGHLEGTEGERRGDQGRRLRGHRARRPR